MLDIHLHNDLVLSGMARANHSRQFEVPIFPFYTKLENCYFRASQFSLSLINASGKKLGSERASPSLALELVLGFGLKVRNHEKATWEATPGV